MPSTFAVLLLLSAAHAAKKPAAKAAPINVTGTWDTTLPGGTQLVLQQKGALVIGKDGGGNYVRGDWNEGLLTLFWRDPFKADGSDCGRPLLLVFASKGVVSRLNGVTWNDAGEINKDQALVRNSPEGGADFDYPYAAELKDCHSLVAHDLAFATASDKLLGGDWPLLAGAADALKKDAALKVKVVGHTDSTGDADANKDLSRRRAEAVKKVLADKYGADAARIATDGMGADQPIAPNDTDEGRALNRRVEILVAR